MPLYELKTKQAMAVRPGAEAFLKAYSTNTADRPRNAFVDIHGRIVAVFDQARVDNGEVRIVIERVFAGRLLGHLGKYLDLCATRLEPVPGAVYHDLDGSAEPGPEAWTVPQVRGRLIVSARPMGSDVTDEEYTRFRLANRIPVQGTDFDTELLLNVGDGEFVSYTKGCYLGQEIIARVHHRSKPPKKLIVKRRSECTPEEAARLTSVERDPEGEWAGFLFADNP